MKKLLLHIIFIIIFISFFSCEKETKWPLQNEETNLIIVDGTITDEMKSQSITLTFPVAGLNDTLRPVTGATVIISDEDSVYQLSEMVSGSGKYWTSNTFQGHPGNHYTLFITYENTIYSAKAEMLQGQGFNAMQYAKNSNNDMYHIAWVTGGYDAGNFAMWEVQLDWSNVTGYQSMDPDSCKARLLYYTLPTIDVSQVFAPNTENISFPAGTSIIEKRYSLTREHAEYIRALISETNWQGGFFDCSHANLPTNLSEGAVGFFGACGVTTDSLIVTP